MTATVQSFRIGDLLIDEGLLTNEQLGLALAEQKSSGGMLGEVLVAQGLVSASDLVQTLSKRLGIRGCVLEEGLYDPALLELIGVEEAKRLKVVPMFRVHTRLTVAMAEPQSLPAIDRLRRLTGLRIKPVLAIEPNIIPILDRHAQITDIIEAEGQADPAVTASKRDPKTDEDELVINLDTAADDNQIVKFVNVVLFTAIRQRASDIHVEPSRTGTRIRHRVDGVLRESLQPPAGQHSAIVSRIKVIGRMDIAEKRLPQEGRVRLIALGREIDLRVSSMPTLLGEKLVMRILDKSKLNVQLEKLGFRREALDTFMRVLRQPHGLVLVTGPTGSGKTTTLYSALDMLRTVDRNIITVEDPVEYQLDMINQVQVQESIGMTFARALKSILRQDPDIIMVGEIRDEDTARVAVQAALTGHLVLATLHTNDAPGAVARLLDMGVQPYLVAAALSGVVAQRLVRKVCSQCGTEYEPEPHELSEAGITDTSGASFQNGMGCGTCHGTGLMGRMGIYEVMEVTAAIRRLVHQSAATHLIRQAALEQGGLTLRDEGIVQAIAGRTTLEEVLRVSRNDGETLEDSQETQEPA